MEFLQLFDDLGLDGANDESIRGSAAAMEAVSSGEVDLAMTTAPYVTPLVEQGFVIPLVVANETRLPSLPDVPTMAEAGIAIPHGSWAGALVPAATSDADVAAMFSALESALTNPEVVAQIADLGMVAAPSSSPESFSAYIEEETARLGGVARKFNVVEN
jgi:tripartite-type tricarboxylate transporter receptor subunit TctC